MSVAFSFLDVGVVVIILASAIYAAYRGFVAESLAIFGWIAAAYATLYFGPWCAYYLRDMVSPAWLSEVVGYVVVFLVVLLPLAFASSRIADSVKKSQVGTLDGMLGAGFGILRGAAILGIAYLVFTSFVPSSRQPTWLTHAQTMPVIRASAQIVASIIPDQDIHPSGRESRKSRESTSERASEREADREALTRKAAESEPTPAPKPKPVKHPKKTYGAKDRQALDKLIETTDSDKQ